MTFETIALVAALVCCFVAAAVLALAEVSLIRVRRSEVMVAAETDRRATRLLGLLDSLPKVLNTILLFVLFTQVAAASIGTYLAQRWFGGLGVTFMTLGLSITLFMYAEALPKTLAVRSPLRIAYLVLPVIRPIVRVGGLLAELLMRLAGLGSPEQPALGGMTEAELLAVASESAAAGAITQEDAELFERSLEFGDRTVGEVMVPREQIRHIGAGVPVDTALGFAIEHGHRRIPVVGTSLDDVVGVVRMRDLAAMRDIRPEPVAAEVMTTVLHCAPELGVEDLLRQMQRTGHRLAVIEVTTADDPTPRTVGIATIEDLVAELVGEVEDDAEVSLRPPPNRA